MKLRISFTSNATATAVFAICVRVGVSFISFHIYCFYFVLFLFNSESQSVFINSFIRYGLFSGSENTDPENCAKRNTTRIIIFLPFERKKHFDTFQSLFQFYLYGKIWHSILLAEQLLL